MAPHDISGLIGLHGGSELFVAKLSEFFERTPPVSDWSGPGRKGSNELVSAYYNHPNEPCHLTPFLFNRAGAPWLTQRWVRAIEAAYTAGPEGLCGDEDVGQMSAWFVLAASGLHQACPGDTRYEVFTPLFDRLTFNLAEGRSFTVTAHNNTPDNVYIQSAMLNGKALERCWIDHQDIVAGGTLEMVLGPQANQNWGR
jgi:putative alpha-1,2-mannosidase